MERLGFRFGWVVGVWLLASAAPGAQAFGFDSTSVQRRVESAAYNGIIASYSTGDFVEDQDAESDSATGFWAGVVESNTFPFDSVGSAGRGSASQRSSLTATGIRFSSAIEFDAGLASDGYDSPDDPVGSSFFVTEDWGGGGASELAVSFEIDELTPVVFELMATDSGGQGDGFEANIEVLYYDPVLSLLLPPIRYLERDFSDALVGQRLAFNLGPGRYDLLIEFSSVDFPNADREATFGFLLVVPEPGTGVLLALGLAGLALPRRSDRARPERRSARGGNA